jgi:hypothetical protein
VPPESVAFAAACSQRGDATKTCGSRDSSDASGSRVRSRTTSFATASIATTLASAPRATPAERALARRRLATTASAVSGVPSWK